MSDRGYVLYPAQAVRPPEILPKGAEETGWMPQTNEPVRETPFVLAAVAPFLFFVAGAVVPLDVPIGGSQESAALQQTIVYQQKAEPLEPIADVPDFGWFVQPSEPVRETPPLTPEANVSDPLIQNEALLEDILTRWWQPASEPVRVKPRLVDEGMLARAPPDPELFRPVFPDWWQQGNEPVRETPPRREDLPATQVEILPIAVVFTPAPSADPVRLPAPIVEGGAFAPAPEDFPEQNLLTRWWQAASEPVRVVPQPVPEGGAVANRDPISKLDFEWMRRASEPVQVVPEITRAGGQAPANLEPISKFDFDWWLPASEPVRVVPQPVGEGGQAPANLDPISKLDTDWLRQASEPVRELPRLVDVGVVVRELDPNPLVDFDWWRPAVEPVRTAEPLRIEPDATQVEILPPPEVDQNRWWLQPSEPVRVLPRLVDEGMLVWNLDDLPTGLDELRPASEPVRVAPRAVDEGGLTFEGELPPIADFDWWRPASEPVRQVPPLRPEPDATQVEILPAPLVIDFDWFRPASEPVRESPRLVDEGAFTTQIEPDPAHEGFLGWWPQPSEPVQEAPGIVEGANPRDLRVAVVVLPLDWLPGPVVPIRGVEAVLGQHSAFDATPIVPVFDWFRIPQPPVRVVPRPVDVGGSVSDVAPDLLPLVEGVFRQPALPLRPQETYAHLDVPPVQVEILPPAEIVAILPVPFLPHLARQILSDGTVRIKDPETIISWDPYRLTGQDVFDAEGDVVPFAERPQSQGGAENFIPGTDLTPSEGGAENASEECRFEWND